jgi:hypothetical protein
MTAAEIVDRCADPVMRDPPMVVAMASDILRRAATKRLGRRRI